MARNKGSANFAGSLEALAGAPIDARLVVDNNADLTAAGTYPYHYEGMPVWVKSEAKMYVLNGSDPTISSNWKEIGEGGGGGGGTAGSVYTGTLLASGWNASNQQTLTFTGYDASYHGVIGLPADATSAQMEEYRDCLIRTVSQSGATVTFECEEVPTINLPVEIYCGGGSGSADLPSGGTTGQVLAKKSNADGDVEWKDDNNTAIQVNALPTASATELGNIYQYIGADTASLTNGYFYQCITDGSTYSWVAKKIQKDKDNRTIKNNSTSVIDRNTVNFTDFDIADDSTNEETDIKAHRLTAGELAEICSTLPGATTQYPKYSTTEQIVGEWIDGKPIYQKSFIDVLSSDANIVKNFPIDSSIKIINFSGCVWATNGNCTSISDTYVANNVTYMSRVIKDVANNLSYQTNMTHLKGGTLNLTIQYIKTTD